MEARLWWVSLGSELLKLEDQRGKNGEGHSTSQTRNSVSVKVRTGL